MEDTLTASVREALVWWRTYFKPIKELEELADQDPAMGARVLRKSTDGKLLASIHGLRGRFGIEWRPGKAKVVDPQHASDSVREAVSVYNGEANESTKRMRDDPVLTECLMKFWECELLASLGADMRKASKAAELNGEDPARAACEAYFIHQKLDFPLLYAASSASWWPAGNRITRQRAIAELAGWVASNISLSKNRRLEAVLDTGEGTPFQNLLQELPAATVVEWDDGRQPERFLNFVNLVTQRLEVEGSQAVLLRTRDKLADTSSEDATEHVSDEHALEAFHLREELHTIEGAAGLSQQERQVIELLLRDYKQCDIADALGVTEGTVKTVKYRAVNKLRRAAGH